MRNLDFFHTMETAYLETIRTLMRVDHDLSDAEVEEARRALPPTLLVETTGVVGAPPPAAPAAAAGEGGEQHDGVARGADEALVHNAARVGGAEAAREKRFFLAPLLGGDFLRALAAESERVVSAVEFRSFGTLVLAGDEGGYERALKVHKAAKVALEKAGLAPTEATLEHAIVCDEASERWQVRFTALLACDTLAEHVVYALLPWRSLGVRAPRAFDVPFSGAWRVRALRDLKFPPGETAAANYERCAAAGDVRSLIAAFDAAHGVWPLAMPALRPSRAVAMAVQGGAHDDVAVEVAAELMPPAYCPVVRIAPRCVAYVAKTANTAALELSAVLLFSGNGQRAAWLSANGCLLRHCAIGVERRRVSQCVPESSMAHEQCHGGAPWPLRNESGGEYRFHFGDPDVSWAATDIDDVLRMGWRAPFVMRNVPGRIQCLSLCLTRRRGVTLVRTRASREPKRDQMARLFGDVILRLAAVANGMQAAETSALIAARGFSAMAVRVECDARLLPFLRARVAEYGGELFGYLRRDGWQLTLEAGVPCVSRAAWEFARDTPAEGLPWLAPALPHLATLASLEEGDGATLRYEGADYNRDFLLDDIARANALVVRRRDGTLRSLPPLERMEGGRPVPALVDVAPRVAGAFADVETHTRRFEGRMDEELVLPPIPRRGAASEVRATFIEGGPGSGKSTVALRLLARVYEANLPYAGALAATAADRPQLGPTADDFCWHSGCLWVTARDALVHQAVVKLGVDRAVDMRKFAGTAEELRGRHMVVTVHSLHKVLPLLLQLDERYRFVMVIDEANTIFHMDYMHPDLIGHARLEQTFTRLFASVVPHVLVLDATMPRLLMRGVAARIADGISMRWVYDIEVPRLRLEHYIIGYSEAGERDVDIVCGKNSDDVVSALAARRVIEEGRRAAIFCSSRAVAELTRTYFVEGGLAPSEVVMYTSKSKAPWVDFLQMARQSRVLVYTTAIGCGVDLVFTDERGDPLTLYEDVYVLGGGAAHSDLIQVLNRVRHFHRATVSMGSSLLSVLEVANMHAWQRLVAMDETGLEENVTKDTLALHMQAELDDSVWLRGVLSDERPRHFTGYHFAVAAGAMRRDTQPFSATLHTSRLCAEGYRVRMTRIDDKHDPEAQFYLAHVAHYRRLATVIQEVDEVDRANRRGGEVPAPAKLLLKRQLLPVALDVGQLTMFLHHRYTQRAADDRDDERYWRETLAELLRAARPEDELRDEADAFREQGEGAMDEADYALFEAELRSDRGALALVALVTHWAELHAFCGAESAAAPLPEEWSSRRRAERLAAGGAALRLPSLFSLVAERGRVRMVPADEWLVDVLKARRHMQHVDGALRARELMRALPSDAKCYAGIERNPRLYAALLRRYTNTSTDFKRAAGEWTYRFETRLFVSLCHEEARRSALGQRLFARDGELAAYYARGMEEYDQTVDEASHVYVEEWHRNNSMAHDDGGAVAAFIADFNAMGDGEYVEPPERDVPRRLNKRTAAEALIADGGFPFATERQRARLRRTHEAEQCARAAAAARQRAAAPPRDGDDSDDELASMEDNRREDEMELEAESEGEGDAL